MSTLIHEAHPCPQGPLEPVERLKHLVENYKRIMTIDHKSEQEIAKLDKSLSLAEFKTRELTKEVTFMKMSEMAKIQELRKSGVIGREYHA
jgi:hypothetical protein